MKAGSLGKLGEDYACEYLKGLGINVLARRYRSFYGEVDLICTDGEFICFVEVKTRTVGTAFSGEAAVTVHKQKKIIRTALLYLQEYPTERQPRFDVLSILARKDGGVEDCVYWKGAFDGEACAESL